LNVAALRTEIINLILIIFDNKAALLTGFIEILCFYHIATLRAYVVHLTLAYSHHEAVLGLIDISASSDHIASL